MSLDIGLAPARRMPLSPAEPVVSFDDDENGGYHWFLHPFFHRLAEKTGQYIDLYGDAEFCGADLQSLRDTLLDARQRVAAQPERWSVYVGTATMPNAPVPPPPREVLKEVERSEMLALIDRFLAVVERSKITGLPVVCFGD
jgi:hypothetical protein